MEKEKILNIVSECVGSVSGIDFNDYDVNLLDSGTIDSMSAISLISQIEEKLSIEFAFSDYTSQSFFSINNISETAIKIICK